MDPPSRPTTKSSTNGSPMVTAPVTETPPAVPQPQPNSSIDTPRSPSPPPPPPPPPQDKRYSMQHAPLPPHKRNDSQKRSGFGLFGKYRDDDDDRDQLKKLKAENKVLKGQLRELEIKSNQIGAENERFKNSMIGDRKINNQLYPDSHYTSLLERLSVGIMDWTFTHFRGKNSRPYTIEMVEEIRTGLKKLSDANNLIPQTLHWVDVDLQTALTDSKFRIAFVLHVIGLYLHERVFSPFSYEIEDFGLGYWLKRVSDEVVRSEATDSYFKWDWSKTLFKAIPEMFDGPAVQTRIFRRIKRTLRPIHPRDLPDDAIFEKLQQYIGDATEIAVAMRLEQGRFVSTFPIQGATYVAARHTTGGEEQTGPIRMCTFPGIIKQSMFLGASLPSDISIFRARVHLESSFQHLKLAAPSVAQTAKVALEESRSDTNVKEV